eukprot:TRINITY_DN9057_c0_g1_i1.p1 TRINITY_DN9057_c0_g1~~TRINITY_DN9057_c0_g1_i1.p1  ORF type:complete len:1038 (+),score=381.25 TRINITY_DN9057_c0_g1_i1:106-3219(+)
MDPFVEQKFKKLREQLDDFGYRAALGIESLPLVERLFADLLQTTASLKAAKEQTAPQPSSNARRHDGDVVVADLEPLKRDNARLVKEVNQLHGELIRRRDVADAQLKKLKAHMRGMEHENNDLRFLNSQYAQRIRVLERDHDSKKERIESLLEKNLQAVVTVQDGSQAQMPTRRQRLEVSSFLPEHSSAPPAPTSQEQVKIDHLKAADAQVRQLEEELRKVDRDQSATAAKMAALQAQVERRDKEIARLGQMLEGGRPAAALRAETRLAQEARHMAHLETQVDFLQQSNKALQDELVSATEITEDVNTKIAQLEADNGKLTLELTRAQEIAQQLQHQHVSSSSQVQRAVVKERAALDRQRQNLNAKLRQASEAESDAKFLQGENKQLTQSLGQATKEVERLQRDMEKLLDDNDYLNTRTAQLEANVRALSSELRQQGVSRVDVDKLLETSKKTSKTSGDKRHDVTRNDTDAEDAKRLRDLLETVSKERDHYRQACLKLEANQQTQSSEQSKDADTTKEELVRLRAALQTLEAQIAHQEQTSAAPGISKQQLEVAERRANELQAAIEAVKRERDAAVDKAKQLAAAEQSRQQRLSARDETAVKTLEQQQRELTRTLTDLRARHSSLQEQADLFQRDKQQLVVELEARTTKMEQLRVLMQQYERDNLAKDKRIQELESQQQLTSNELSSRLASDQREIEQLQRQLTAAQDAIRTADRERDAVQMKLARLLDSSSELNQVRSQLEEAQQQHETQQHELLQQQRQLENELEEQNGVIARLRQQLHSNEDQSGTAADVINGLRDTIDRLETDLGNMTQECQRLSTDLENAHSEKVAMEQSTHNYMAQLRQLTDELQASEQQKQELFELYHSMSTENSELESRVSEVDTLTDEAATTIQQSQSQLQELTQRLHASEAVKAQQAVDIAGFESRTARLTGSLAQMEQNLRELEEERSSLQSQLDMARNLNVDMGTSHETLSRELGIVNGRIRQLEGDKNSLKASVRELQQQRDEAQSQARHLERQLQLAQAQVTNLEQRVKLAPK